MTEIGKQAPIPPHPLGFHIWRRRNGAVLFAQRVREAWWILTGKWSLHRAWQRGFDGGTQSEYRRSITNLAAVADLKAMGFEVKWRGDAQDQRAAFDQQSPIASQLGERKLLGCEVHPAVRERCNG